MEEMETNMAEKAIEVVEEPREKKSRKGLIITLIILLLLVAVGIAAFHPASPLSSVVASWLAPEPADHGNTDDEGLLPDEYVVVEAEVTVKVVFSAEGVGIEGVGNEPTALEALMDAASLASAADALTAGSLDSTGVTLDLKLTGFEYPLPDGLTDPAQVEAFATQYAQLQERVSALETPGVSIECLPCTDALSLLPGTYEASVPLFVIDAEGHVWRLTDPPEEIAIEGDTEITLTFYAVDLAAEDASQLLTWAIEASEAGLYDASAALMAATAEEEEEEETPVIPGGTGGSSGTRPGGNSGGGNGGGTVAPPAGHTHSWGPTEYVVTREGHYETVNHPAEYKQWSECIEVCATCGATITSNPSGHCEATGHRGWYTDYIYHSELIREAWSEEVWVPESGYYVHYCRTCDAFETWN